MGTWSPSRLPKIREQTQRVVGDSGSFLRQRHGRPNSSLDHLGRSLGVAELFWVTAEMAACAVGCASRLTHVRWAIEDRPSAYGLIVFDGGIGGIDYGGILFPCDAVSWGPHPGGVMFGFYTRRSRMEETLAAQNVQLVYREVPPLIPFGGHIEPVTAEPVPVDQVDEQFRTLLSTLSTTWALMRQPRATERLPVDVDRKVARGLARAGLPVPEVKLITLRRALQPTGPAGELEPDQPGRHYRHRWYVPSFPRWQRKGLGLSQTELIMVGGHIRGPAGAPLLQQEKVNVWRK